MGPSHTHTHIIGARRAHDAETTVDNLADGKIHAINNIDIASTNNNMPICLAVV